MSFYRNRNYIVLFFMFQVFCRITGAQDMHFSNMHENMMKINPASTTETEQLTLHLTYRNQWPGSTDFVTYNGSLYQRFETFKSTIGIDIFRDQQGEGIINLTSYSLIYGYYTLLSDNLGFAAGLKVSYERYSINYSMLTFENPLLSLSADDISDYDYFDFNSGVEFNYKQNSKFGFSLAHITNISSRGQIQQRKYSFAYRGNYNLSNGYKRRDYTAEPLLYVSLQGAFNEILYGSRWGYGFLTGGLYCRQDYRFHYDAMIVLLGIIYNNYTFVYTYDINLSGTNSNFKKLAAHEVTFLYNLQYKSRSKKKRGAIKCPDI